MNQNRPTNVEGFDHQVIEAKWQKRWQTETATGAEDFSKRTKKYLLVEFPYPSGDGLHVGHIRSYAAFDALARFYRLKGENVLYPIGWDAFGLPTENYALKTGIHPRQATDQNIANFRRQMQSLGLLFDWPREVDTTDPKYYRWTQWLFLQLFKKGLAYQATIPINWCTSCKIGLANEEVVAGKCERCGTEVVRRLQKQWMLKITAYAERLLKDLNTVDYLPKMKTQQVNWIGKSEGAEIKFEVKSEKLKVKNEKLRFVLLHGFNGTPEGIFFPWLIKNLKASGAEVIAPALPHPTAPTEAEQVNYVLENVQFDENTVLFGHSLGTIVAMKVAERLKTKITGLVLAGGFVEPRFKDRPRPFHSTFKWEFDFKKIKANAGSITVLNALNDYAVTIEAGRRLAKSLGVQLNEVTAQDEHFTAKEEPVILDALLPSIKVFTTRPDTIFGATYLVLSPEHEVIEKLKLSPYGRSPEGGKIENYREVEKYIQKAAKKSDLDRTDLAKDKTGVELKGIQAINPANNEPIPIWVADYVLTSYGTGAIMAVPGHDERDFEFAKKFKLPVRYVVEPKFVAKPNGDSVIKEGEEFVKRQAVCAIVRNPKTGKYLCVSWKTVHMHGLVTGGIDDGEDLVEAARREVLEETGYKNLKLVKVSPVAIHSLFYHRVKQQNRWARFQYVFFDLENEARVAVEEKEAALHEVLWLSKNEMKDFFTVVEGEFVLKLIESPDYIYTGHGVMMNSGSNDWLEADEPEMIASPMPPDPLEAVASAGAYGRIAPDKTSIVRKGELLPGNYNGLDSEAAGKAIVEWLSEKYVAKPAVQYKLRDWVFSRQHYWGEPIPIVHCSEHGAVPVPENQLPVELPYVEKYQPSGTGESPLASVKEWVNTKCPQCGQPAKRETDTMPNWAGSSWYYLRYCDPKNDREFAELAKLRYWLPVDLYNGGMEHTTLHLLYSRFWHKFLFDEGLVPTSEPYQRRHSHGIVLAEDGRKMSKSFGNVINPDDYVREYGADALRMYEMFMGPFEDTIPWSTNGLVGVRRFLEKIFELITYPGSKMASELMSKTIDINELIRIRHITIKKVTEDIENLQFNTAVSSLMELTNFLRRNNNLRINKEFIETEAILLRLLFPFAPHLTSELWERFFDGNIIKQPWPDYDPKKIIAETFTLVVQVNGKVRAKIEAPMGITETEAVELAKKDLVWERYLEGRDYRVVFVPNRLISFIVS